jgi:hypothetical protein
VRARVAQGGSARFLEETIAVIRGRRWRRNVPCMFVNGKEACLQLARC